MQNRCAGESTELRTMPTEDNQRTCFSVARVDLSEGMGVLLDYTRIMAVFSSCSREDANMES